jgi:hypothetical protein
MSSANCIDPGRLSKGRAIVSGRQGYGRSDGVQFCTGDNASAGRLVQIEFTFFESGDRLVSTWVIFSGCQGAVSGCGQIRGNHLMRSPDNQASEMTVRLYTGSLICETVEALLTIFATRGSYLFAGLTLRARILLDSCQLVLQSVLMDGRVMVMVLQKFNEEIR